MYEKLSRVTQLIFNAQTQTGSQTDWNTQATGQTTVRLATDCIDFDDEIVFPNGRVAHDKKRWLWDGNRLIFCRWRNDDYEPIFAFTQGQGGQWLPECPYWCAPDEYRGSLRVRDDGKIECQIHIVGARKNDIITYLYF